MYADKLSSVLGQPVEITALPIELRYGRAALRREALKAGAGAAICGTTVATLSPAPLIAWPVGIAGLLFVGYLAEQGRRSRVGYRVDAQGVERVLPRRGARVTWNGLDRLRLKFYPHRRRALQGTLVLHLSAGAARIKVDSSLTGFPTLLLHAGAAARERGLEFDPTTLANLDQLGL